MLNFQVPFWCSVTVPEPLVDFLTGVGFDLLPFLLHETGMFWRGYMDVLFHDGRPCYLGCQILAQNPEYRLLCCVCCYGFEPWTAEAAIAADDFLQALLVQIRWYAHQMGVVVPEPLLNLLQITQEEDALAPFQ